MEGTNPQPSFNIHQQLQGNMANHNIVMYATNIPTPPHFDTRHLIPSEGPLLPGFTSMCHYSAQRCDRNWAEDCIHLRERCPTCEYIDQMASRGLPYIKQLPLESRQQAVDHLRRRVDRCGRKVHDFQRLIYDWQREASLAGTYLFYLNLASEVVERETSMTEPDPISPPSERGTPTLDESIPTPDGNNQGSPQVSSGFDITKAPAQGGDKSSCTHTATKNQLQYSIWNGHPANLDLLNTPGRYSPISPTGRTAKTKDQGSIPSAPAPMALMDERWKPTTSPAPTVTIHHKS